MKTKHVKTINPLSSSLLLHLLLISLIFFFTIPASASDSNCPVSGSNYKCQCDADQQIIDCRNQQLDTIPPAIPESATSLYLNTNEIGTLEGISDLSNLVYLNLESNKVKKIQFDLFDNMDSLQTLVLAHNEIESIDDDTFEWNPLKLEKINLAANKFKFIQHFLFYDLERLQEIILSHNQIAFIHPHAFQQLKELRSLDISYNHVHTFNPQWIKGLGAAGLQELSFNNNPWHCDCGMSEAFDFFKDSDNFWIKTMGSGAELVCNGTDSSASSYHQKLIDQQKESLPCKPPRIVGISKESNIPAGRSVLLRCQAEGAPMPQISWIAPNEDVYRAISDNFKGVTVNEDGSLLIEGLKDSDTGDYICQASSSATNGQNKVAQVKTKITIIPADGSTGEHKPDDIDIPAGSDQHQDYHIEDDCPKACSCQNGQIDCSHPRPTGEDPLTMFPRINSDNKGLKDSTTLYNLEGNVLTSIPEKVCSPFTALNELRLDNNHIAEFSRNSFSGCDKLKVLTLRKNRLNRFDGEYFSGMAKLEILVLDENNIQTLERNSFYNMPSLKWLYIRNNKLQQVDRNAFGSLAAISFIHMEENFLQTIDHQWVDTVKGLNGGEAKIFFRENPVWCDCRLKDFWKKESYYGETVDFEEIVCQSPVRNRDLSLAELDEGDLSCEAGDDPRPERAGPYEPGTFIPVDTPSPPSTNSSTALFFGLVLGMACSIGGFFVYRKWQRGNRLGMTAYTDIAYRDISNALGSTPEHQDEQAQGLTSNQGGGTEAYV